MKGFNLSSRDGVSNSTGGYLSKKAMLHAYYELRLMLA